MALWMGGMTSVWFISVSAMIWQSDWCSESQALPSCIKVLFRTL